MIFYQTLSDEDSFKKCSSVEDAKSRIRQLVNSLLYRYAVKAIIEFL